MFAILYRRHNENEQMQLAFDGSAARLRRSVRQTYWPAVAPLLLASLFALATPRRSSGEEVRPVPGAQYGAPLGLSATVGLLLGQGCSDCNEAVHLGRLLRLSAGQGGIKASFGVGGGFLKAPVLPVVRDRRERYAHPGHAGGRRAPRYLRRGRVRACPPGSCGHWRGCPAWE
jgi:hypothetical protein